MTLSTHVLDATGEQPAAAVRQRLHRRVRDDWRCITSPPLLSLFAYSP